MLGGPPPKDRCVTLQLSTLGRACLLIELEVVDRSGVEPDCCLFELPSSALRARGEAQSVGSPAPQMAAQIASVAPQPKLASAEAPAHAETPEKVCPAEVGSSWSRTS